MRRRQAGVLEAGDQAPDIGLRQPMLLDADDRSCGPMLTDKIVTGKVSSLG